MRDEKLDLKLQILGPHPKVRLLRPPSKQPDLEIEYFPKTRDYLITCTLAPLPDGFSWDWSLTRCPYPILFKHRDQVTLWKQTPQAQTE